MLVAGGLDEQERYRQVLETGLPGISLRTRVALGHDGADIENISGASAESHFAIVDGTGRFFLRYFCLFLFIAALESATHEKLIAAARAMAAPNRISLVLMAYPYSLLLL